MPEIRLPCSGCGAVLRLTDALADVQVRCPHCKIAVAIPSAEAVEPLDSPEILTVELAESREPPRRPADEEERPRRGERRDKDRPARKPESARQKPAPKKKSVAVVLVSVATGVMVCAYALGLFVVATGIVPMDGWFDEDEAARAARIARLRPEEEKLVERLATETETESHGLAVATIGNGKGPDFGGGSRPVFSPDGQLLAAIRHENSSVVVWDLPWAKRLHDLVGFAKNVKFLAFARDGTLLVADSQKVWLFDARAGKELRSYPMPDVIALSPDGRRAVGLSGDWGGGYLQLWNLKDGSQGAVVGPFDFRQPAACFSPNGKTLATACPGDDGRGNLCLWEVRSGGLQRSFAITADQLAFSPDGRTLAAADLWRGKNVHLLDVATGVERVLAHGDSVGHLTFSPDAKLLLTRAGNDLHLWDVAEGKELCSQKDFFASLTFSPGGVYLVAESGEVFLTADLLDRELMANLVEAKKLAHVTRFGTGFHVVLTGEAKIETLRRLKKLLRRLSGVGLQQIGGVNDEWLAELKSTPELRRVHLSGADVTDAGLAHLAGLENLESLSLSYSRGISDAGLAHLEGTTGLKHLALSGTRITSKGMTRLAGMKQMRVLDLAGCWIGEEGLKELAGMTELTELNLYNANVTDAGLAHLSGMTQMTKLNLNGNRGVRGDGLAHLAGMKSLRELDLADTGLEDGSLARLAGLTNLTRLDLRGTKLTDRGLSSVRGMKKLETLALPTGLTDAGLAPVGECVNLESLDWGEAKGITGPGLAHLARLKKITYWDLSQTGVTNAGLAHLRGAKHVTSLHLPPQIGDAGLEHVAALTALYSLNLNETQVTDAGLARLAGLHKLTFLNLDGTRVTGAGLAPLPELHYLSLDKSKATDAGLAGISKLAALTSLSLDQTDVGDEGLSHLQKMPKLEGLYVRKTRITDRGVAHLSKLAALTSLNLDQTDVGDEGLSHLQRAPKLERLDVSQTRVTDKGVADLKKALPKLEVRRQ